jgi:uncharacterized membrane protein/glutaredoxin
MATVSVPPSSRRARRQRRAQRPAWTRDPLLLIAAAVGLLVSAYLAVVDLTGGSALCIAGSDCDIVRASAYGRLLGVPLALLGVGFFLAVLVGGLLKVAWQPRLLQVLGGVGLAAALAFVGLQALVLNAWCPWCLVADAAALAIGLRVLWPSAAAFSQRALLPGAAGAAMAVAVLVVGYTGAPAAMNGTPAASTAGTGGTGQSGAADQLTALAAHLRDSGAVFYGAYWCSHCQAQKQMFGAAAAQLPYMECDPRGTNPQPAACQAAGVRAFPTWIINGQKVEGEVQPAELARLSGFGSQ